MLTTILIATIIHMNIGFELPEALWRGIGSAAIIAGIGLGITMIVIIISLIADKISELGK